MKDKKIADQRIKEFKKDVLNWKKYDYVVINDELKKCFHEVNKIIESEINESKIDYDKKKIEEHVAKLVG